MSDGQSKQGRLTLLDIRNVSYNYPGADERALRDINLQVYAGECCVVTGASGSGKTTLLMAMQGLLTGHDGQGAQLTIRRDRDVRVAMVFQNADSQILCTTVKDEAAFGPENIGFSPDETAAAVSSALSAVGLAGFEGRNVEELSAGEKHRLTLASVLSMNPGILLLDEPSAQLDDVSKEKLKTILADLKAKRHTLMIADHELTLYGAIADRYIVMTEGGIEKVQNEPPSRMRIEPVERYPAVTPGEGTDERRSISVENLFLTGHNGIPLFRDMTFSVPTAATAYLYGQNGAGKSTLLSCMMGLIEAETGTIRIAGMASPRPRDLLGKAALLFQNPSRQLFEETVFDEVAFSLKRLGYSADRTKEHVFEVLKLFDMEGFAGRSPLTLSFGEQHRVALASVLAPRPAVLLLDEPFAGLDFEQRISLSEILTRLRDRYRTTVLIASHTGLPDPLWPDVRLLLKEGAVETF